MSFRATFYMIVGALGALGGCFYSAGFALGLFSGALLGAVFGFVVSRRWA